MLKKVLGRAHLHFYAGDRDKRAAEVESKVPAFAKFLSDLAAGNATGVSSHPWRALDILRVLEKRRPKRIVEFGGGTSTALFAHYVRATPGTSLLSIDESEEWSSLTKSALKGAGLSGEGIQSVTSSRVDSEYGSYYGSLPTLGAVDLLYIDGPTILNGEYGNRLPNLDVLALLDTGALPEVIMVDGRISTVDAIKAHTSGKAYHLTPGVPFFLAPKTRVTLSSLRLFGKYHRHSIFERIN